MTLADPSTSTAAEGTREPLSEGAVAARILLTVLIALVAWGLAIFTWGVPGLYIPALAMVPVVWVALLWLTFGR